MFFFPYSTDAPIYYWPIATVCLMLANIGAYIGVVTGKFSPMENWLLSFGAGLHPQEWLSSIFMHASPMHLVGNLLFLWLFGLIVEGKLGWFKFLACYLAIGMVQRSSSRPSCSVITAPFPWCWRVGRDLRADGHGGRLGADERHSISLVLLLSFRRCRRSDLFCRAVLRVP